MQSTPTEHSIPLSYSVIDSSSHSGRYSPRNILIDNPNDQGSRWSAAVQSNSNHWILLRLNNLAVLKTITFGKYHKPHPCTMKEFKVFVGTKQDHMIEVLHSYLKNDHIPETFSIKYVNSAGLCFPTLFIKIIPLSAHGQSFNSSIWHVSMTGISDEAYVDKIKKIYDEFRETQVLRHVLKHLRQRRLLTPYDSILSRSSLQVEHPLISKLHETIVLQGNWEQAIDLLSEISDAGLFDSYLHLCQPYAKWKQIHDTDIEGEIPVRRGGHAMCIDHVNGIIYLFGGWDGHKSLDDFWMYDIKKSRWSIISRGTWREHNAPGPRSCHKMVHDPKTGCIYVLGRLGDEEIKSSQEGGSSTARPGADASTTSPSSSKPPSSEFYRYHIESGQWTCLSNDAASSNGPPLIFDHQMVMDSEAQMLYVFGGRILDSSDWDSLKYSGLYSYNVQNNKWRLLQPPDNVSHPSSVTIPPRFGHSMVLEPNSRTLYIFAGQRDDKYLSDMYTYDLATNTATEIYSNFTSAGGPEACFTQRAVIDPRLHEIYVFCGLTRNQQNGSVTYLASEPSNWVYRYHPRPGQWTKMLSESDSTDASNGSLDADAEAESEEPVPRYAHQVVYDSTTRTVYMHGGNAGFVGAMERHHYSDGNGEETRNGGEHEEAQAQQREDEQADGEKEKRLDDFWKMSLSRPSTKEIIRQATYYIRQQQFREMCTEKPAVQALSFLQNDVSSVVDHSNPKEAETFRALLRHLVNIDSSPSPSLESESSGVLGDTSLTPGDEAPPRKRSRSNASVSEDEETRTRTQIVMRVSGSRLEGVNGSGSSLKSGTGTNRSSFISSSAKSSLSSSSSSTGIVLGVDKEKLQATVDPMEETSCGGGAMGIENESDGDADRFPHSHKPEPLTQKIFEQRNEVFESLLEFVAEDAKQPGNSLLDLIDVD